MASKLIRLTDPEEVVNSITHGVGLALSVVGCVFLLALALLHHNGWRILSCAIYGSTLVGLYTASTLYHGIQSPHIKRVLKIFDHCAIYLLISGTYTPFMLVNLRGGWGWFLFGVVWGLAMVGIVFKMWFADCFQALSTALYVVMGWLAVLATKPLVAHVPSRGLKWLLAGGVIYTIGIVFYVSRTIRYSHAIWHAFVVAGSFCHYVAVLYAVVLPTNR